MKHQAKSMAEEKKISFGFSKLKAQPKIIKPVPTSGSTKSQTNSLQYIDCLEDQSIKVKNEIVEEKKELVIPLKPSNVSKRIIKIETNFENAEIKKEKLTESTKNSEISNSTVNPVKIKVEVDDTQDVNTLDAQARREILASLSQGEHEESETKVFSLPLTTNAPKEGEKESTLDDYENIPIQEFGMAMLRGMGWKADETKKNNKPTDIVLRPKGLGLGADKSAANAAKAKSTANPEDSKLIKNCCVTITGGMYKNRYGKLESFNEDSGRVVVKLALGNEHVTVSETLLLRVTKGEYDKNCRVINMKKYEEYKNQDAKHETNEGDKSSKNKRRNSSDDDQIDRKSEKKREHSKYRSNSDSDSEEKQEKKYRKSYRENENNKHEDRSRTQEIVKSKKDINERRKDFSSDSEDESRSHYSIRKDDKYQSSKSQHSRENHSSSTSHRSKMRDAYESDERHSRKSSKQESSSQHQTNSRESKRYTKSRDPSGSPSDDEDKYNKNSKHDRQPSRFKSKSSDRDRKRKIDERDSKKIIKKRRSRLDSEDSSCEEDRKKTEKKSKRHGTDSSEEDRRNKNKKSKHKASSSDESEEDRRKKTKKSKYKASSSDESEEDRRKKTKKSKYKAFSSDESEEDRRKKTKKSKHKTSSSDDSDEDRRKKKKSKRKNR